MMKSAAAGVTLSLNETNGLVCCIQVFWEWIKSPGWAGLFAHIKAIKIGPLGLCKLHIQLNPINMAQNLEWVTTTHSG